MTDRQPDQVWSLPLSTCTPCMTSKLLSISLIPGQVVHPDGHIGYAWPCQCCVGGPEGRGLSPLWIGLFPPQTTTCTSSQSQITKSWSMLLNTDWHFHQTIVSLSASCSSHHAHFGLEASVSESFLHSRLKQYCQIEELAAFYKCACFCTLFLCLYLLTMN